MSFADQVLEHNPEMLSVNEDRQELIAKPGKSDSLKTVFTWAKNEYQRIEKDLTSFRDHLEWLYSNNTTFRNFVLKNNQKAIVEEIGITQSYCSDIFGSRKKEYAEKLKAKAIGMVDEGKSPEVAAQKYGMSAKTLKRAIDKRNEETGQNIGSDILSGTGKQYSGTTAEDLNPMEHTKKETLIYKGNPVLDQQRREVMGQLSREELADMILERDLTITALESNIRQKDREIAMLKGEEQKPVNAEQAILGEEYQNASDMLTQ
ncbi:MAG: helix-turn-helix domain-containing protein [Lentisphaeraceae bacterium]|nr:helix-turn-helix domain-containing protein [Lentisphaeraceae bacterium]